MNLVYVSGVKLCVEIAESRKLYARYDGYDQRKHAYNARYDYVVAFVIQIEFGQVDFFHAFFLFAHFLFTYFLFAYFFHILRLPST